MTLEEKIKAEVADYTLALFVVGGICVLFSGVLLAATVYLNHVQFTLVSMILVGLTLAGSVGAGYGFTKIGKAISILRFGPTPQEIRQFTDEVRCAEVWMK